MTGRWRERLARLINFAGTKKTDADLDQEFQSHLELAADEYLRQGHSPAEARRLAAARFGSRLAARERVADQQGLPQLESPLSDLRYAIRGLRRTPGFTAVAMTVLGVGIGVNLAVFTVANATLFKGFRGVAGQERLVYVTTGRDCCISYLDLTDWRAEATSFEALAAVADLRVSIDAGNGPETATATEVTSELFGILRARPVLGRDFVPADEVAGAARVAVLSHHFWRTRFGANPGVLSQIVRVNGAPTAIVGVMPPDFAFPQQQDLWLPLGARLTGQPRNARGLWFAVGRLAHGVTVAQARSELDAIGARMAAAYPATNAGVRPFVQTFREFFVGPNAIAIYGALWGGVSLLLVIACANLANLLFARAAGRAREFGVCLALGAGRARVIRLQLFESLMVSTGAGLIGWWLAAILLRGYAAIALPPTQPWASQLFDYSVDLRVFAYLAVLSVIVAVAIGLLPALRIAGLDVQGVLRDGGRGAVGGHNQRRATSRMVMAQVAMAVVLLSAAGVLARSFWSVHSRDLGYDPTRVVVALTTLPASIYPDVEAQFGFFDRLASGVRTLPGVSEVGFIDSVSGQGGGRVAIDIDGRPVATAENRPQARQMSISANYFNTLGTPLLSGRDFDARDHAGAQPAVIVNRRFANLHWQTDDVVGQRIRVFNGTSEEALTIVGVAPDLHHGDRARPDVEPAIYRPLRQKPARGAWILARTSLPPRSLVASLRRQIQLADPELPVWLGPYTLEEWNAGAYWHRGVNGGLFVLFAGLALGLASIGLFAVMAAMVAQRRQELSVRIAIGASAADVVWLIVRQGLASALYGLALGLLASLATNRLLSGQLVDIAPWDPATLATVAALITVSTLIGSLVPAVQATRVDPLSAMRFD
jgi:predicted permease